MLSRISFLLGLGILLANIAYAQQAPLGYNNGLKGPILTPEFRARIGELLSNASVPGYSIALVNLDKGVEFGNWGIRSEEGDSMTSDTLYMLASVSKQFTATALGLIIDDYEHGRNVTPLPNGLHELRWNTKVKDILPDDWALMDPWAHEKASLNDVLSHVSGITRHEIAYKSKDTPLDRVRLLRHLRPDYELREHWSYNNQMYMLASRIISVLSNSTFDSFLRRRIFTPLNMTRSTVDPTEASQPITHAWVDVESTRRRVPELMTPYEARLVAGAGAIMSSAEDMARWISVLLQAQEEGQSNEREPVPGSVIREVMRPLALVGAQGGSKRGFDTQLATYGKGWMQINYRGHHNIQHNGAWISYTTLLSLYPNERFGFVLLANANNKDAVNLDVSLLIADEVLGLQPLSQAERAGAIQSFPFVDTFKPATCSTKICGSQLPHTADSSFQWALETFTLTYNDPGYGSLTLCTVYSASPQCRRVLAVYASISPDNTVNKNHLYAEWFSPAASHLSFVPLSSEDDTDGNSVVHFQLQPTIIYPEGYGKNKTAFELSIKVDDTKSEAEFVLDKKGEVVGMGWFGVLGAGSDHGRRPGTTEESAEVWFVAERP